MMKSSEFTEQEKQQIQAAFDDLLDAYAHTPHRQKVEIIQRAYTFANQAHYGVRRLSGEPYIMHPLSVAKIVVSEIGLGSTSICAALLHDVVEDTDYTVEDIRYRFGEKIASIVEGLTKISGGIFADKASQQAENFRKLLLTMSDDIRVVLIKLADRLHNMRTLDAQAPEKQKKIAEETQYIYAPLAHRLGFFPIKSELENLSFRYTNPKEYKEISDKLDSIKLAKMANLEIFMEPIRFKLESLGYHYTLSARLKSVYSIYKKMQTKGVPFENVYDLMAVRIVFTPNEAMSEKDQCWILYAAITEIYPPHPERIRDWISTPKANGYEALHVTVMSNDGQWVEVQIRTDRMHEIAEHGLAAHWKYKIGAQESTELDKWLQGLRDVLEHPDTDAMAFLDTFRRNLFSHEVYAFTPNGEIKVLPQQSSVLDFAYMVHTEVGDHCIGAKVNHEVKPASYLIHSGDQIEILTSQSESPKPEWLNMVVTAKAQQAIKRFCNRRGAIEETQPIQPFTATIALTADDRFGLLVDILTAVSETMHLNIRDLHITNTDGHIKCQLEIWFYDRMTIEHLCNALEEIPSINTVERITK